MKDENKTKKQLVKELAQMRQLVAELTGAEAEYKQAEEALRRKRDLMGRIMETSPVGITIVDLEGQITFANTQAEKVLGLTKSEITSRTYNAPDWHITDYDGNPFPDEKLPFQQVMTAQQPVYDVRRVIEWPDGRRVLLSINGTPHLDETGQVDRVVFTIEDITERMKAEEALQESEERYRSVVENSHAGILIVDDAYQFIYVNDKLCRIIGYPREEIIGQDFRNFLDEESKDFISDTYVRRQRGEEVSSRYEFDIVRKDGEKRRVEISSTVIRDPGGHVQTVGQILDITERIQVEETLRQRNRELALFYQASQALSSTLDLDQVLATVLEEVQRLPDVLACSVWLVDPKTDELVCHQATDPQGKIVRGWRLGPGQGLAGWAVKHKQSLNVPDAQADERHFKGVSEQTGLKLRSILTVPLQVKNNVIGVMQTVDDEKVGRFDSTHQRLLESLAATAAIAIQNAQLYEQARQDAETKLALLHEVNHRIKNNLTAIIGLLYAERRHVASGGRTYQDILNNLINRVQGLATAHELLSASEWRALPLSDLARQIIYTALHVLSPAPRVSVDVSPSPVEVSPTQANYLALVINELATNSVKYALPERDRIQITVSIALEQDMICFEFRDDGPGYPENVLQLQHQNVGLYLIQAIVHNSLQGELALHNDHGAVTVIRFKMMQ